MIAPGSGRTGRCRPADKNPYPEKAPSKRSWVGQFWDFFYAGHTVELQNLKTILEYRYANNLPMGPL